MSTIIPFDYKSQLMTVDNTSSKKKKQKKTASMEEKKKKKKKNFWESLKNRIKGWNWTSSQLVLVGQRAVFN